MAIHIIAWLYFIYIHLLVGGFTPSEKYDLVSWDDEIPNRWKIMENTIHVPNHQPDIIAWLYFIYPLVN